MTIRHRVHMLMHHRTLGGPDVAFWVWAIVWLAAFDFLLPLPWYLSFLRAAFVGVTVSYCVHYRVLLNAWLRVRHRKALATPPVLDEDGNVRVAMLMPGETLVVARDGDGRPMGGAVLRRNGSIRVEADWSHR